MNRIYLYEVSNKNIYDGVRECCVAEGVNEEYFRKIILSNFAQGVVCNEKARN